MACRTMNAPLLAEAPSTVPEWRRAVLPLGLGLLLLGALFSREALAAVQTWIDSTAYNHCFLVIPITAYLLWDRRFDLRGIALHPCLPALLLGPPIGVVWLTAERLGIMEGRQLAAISFVELLLLAVLGRRLWWAMAGPLLYLYFLVPFGEFLTPQLQDITTWFVRHGLEVLGVPAYIDGYIIEIPQGTFFIAQACAGLRFLIASIAFGCLYALIMYRSPVRRALFILVSILVPIGANGLRAIGIVYLGYLLNSAQAAAADHVIYGWVFFSLVILLLIALGLPFRQDDMTTRKPTSPMQTPQPAHRRPVTTALALVAIACIAPGLAAGMALATPNATLTPDAIDPGPGCAASPRPAPLPGARSQRVTCGQVAMDMTWQAFSPHATAAAVMAGRRELYRRVDTESLSEAWLETPGQAPSPWRIMRSNEPFYALGVAVWIDGKPARPGLRMRLTMALDSLIGSAHAPMVITVAPALDWTTLTTTERAIAVAGLVDFLQSGHNLGQAVEALTARR